MLLDGMLSFAAGVMVAASFWSLLMPSVEMQTYYSRIHGSSFPPASCAAVFSSFLETKFFHMCSKKRKEKKPSPIAKEKNAV